MISSRKKYIAPIIGIAVIIAAVFVAHGCARYAPVPAPPQLRTMLDVTLITRQNLSNDFYYYIVLDASGNVASDGPHENLTGADRAKNWSYYIMYHAGSFNELILTKPQDADLVPTPLDPSSPRYYSASAASNYISISMYLDTIAPTPRNVWFNFITSAYEINDPTREIINPIDYLTPPYFKMRNDHVPTQESSGTQPQISAFTPVGDANKPADIYLWTTKIYQR